MKRASAIAIVLFWCFMNVLLLKRHLWSPPAPPPLRTALALTEPMEEWWGITYRGEKIGYATQKIVPAAEGYLFNSLSKLRLNLLGTVQTVNTRLEMTVAPDWTLRRFDFQLLSDGVQFGASGKIAAGRLELEVNSGGHRARRAIPLRQPLYVPATLRHYVASRSLEPGSEHRFPTFDPSTLSQQIAGVTVEGRELIKIRGKPVPAIRIRQRFKGISVLAWIDGEGKTLKEEGPGGFGLLRQTPAEAKDLSEKPSLSLDLITETAVPIDTPIAEPTHRSLLKVNLSGFNLADFPLGASRQRLVNNTLEIRREDLTKLRSYRIPLREKRFASFLQPTPFLQSDHPRIRAVARKILDGETDALRAITRLRQWVYRELRKEPTVSIPTALEVLQSKKGDCNEHTVLLNAMARAVGIPAKTVVGVVYLQGAFYYHAWSEVWLGGWVSVDAVMNQFPADVTHIKFLEGEIDRQIDLLELIGNLKIKLVEVS